MEAIYPEVRLTRTKNMLREAWFASAKLYHPESVRPEARRTLTDREILNAAIQAADALDATRVSELRAGRGGSEWHPTTIFDGDAGLLRFGRLVEGLTRGPQKGSE